MHFIDIFHGFQEINLKQNNNTAYHDFSSHGGNLWTAYFHSPYFLTEARFKSPAPFKPSEP